MKTETNQRIVKQLEEVRLGIFKLLSESDDEEKGKEAGKLNVDGEDLTDLGVAPLAEEETPGYTADYDDDSPDSASQSVEINTVNIVTSEPAEVSEVMGCVSADREVSVLIG